MKKTMILLGILIIVLTGCNTSSYETYSSAIKRTEEVATGKMKVNQIMELEFEKEGLSEDEILELKKWEKAQIDVLATFDKTKNQSITELYTSFANLGLGGNIYKDEDKIYIVTALLPKILMVKGDEIEGMQNIEEFEKRFGVDSFDQFQKKWETMMSQENVSTLGNIVVSTPEGEIKTKEYEIYLTKEQILPMIIDGIELINKIIIESQDSEIDIDSEEIRRQIEKSMEEIEFEKIYHRAYIDRDGFIVEEETHIILTIPTAKSGDLKKMDLQIKSQSWDLGKDIDIDIPELREDNIMTIEELQNNSKLMNQFKGGK